MKKLIILSFIISTLSCNNISGMLSRCVKHTTPKSAFRIQLAQQRIRSFHTSKITNNHFEERMWIEEQHEERLLKDPEFLKQVESQQLRNIENLLKKQYEIAQKNNALLRAIAQQNILSFKLTQILTRQNSSIYQDGPPTSSINAQEKQIDYFNISQVQPLLFDSSSDE